MRLLVLTAFYPIPGVTHERMFVHVRNRYYQEHGADVTVLNFAAQEDYAVDGIPVITLHTFEQNHGKYDIVLSHSANVRNHYHFLKKHQGEFKRFVFFFHGHEASMFAKDYPQPYAFSPDGKLTKRVFQYAYDLFKLNVWRSFYKFLAPRSQFVFVSECFYKRALANMSLKPEDLQGHCHVIHNSIGAFFENAEYAPERKKDFDFICIRSNLDASKYCVDLFVALARKYPSKKFLLIGKGELFKFIAKPANLEWVDHTLDHEAMLSYLNDAKCGVMLTRSDTQGVMACEMASIGMPLLSSDIEVCHEILDKLPNVALVPNDVEKIDLDAIYERLAAGLPYPKCRLYFAEETICKEMRLFHAMLEDQRQAARASAERGASPVS